jgi:tyrosinase
MAIHYRRNINCIGTDALHDLREALAMMFTLPASDEHSFAALAGLHGVPGNYCRHGAPGFLTWHRAYMHYFEKALRCVDSSITLPFWDWSSGPTTGVPAACAQPTYVNRSGATVPNPLYAGPLPGGGLTARRADIATTSYADIATAAQGALGSTSFTSFQSSINGPHGSVHVRTGGQMSSVALAGYDPIFYLHHSNVDRLWARWQLSHPGALPAAEAAFALDPFRLPYSNTLRPGSDFATTDQLDYRYSNFCFFFPPIRIWDVIKLDLTEHMVLERAQTARLIVRSNKMPATSAELRVFLNAPDANAETPTQNNPQFAGAIGLFGMTSARPQHDRPSADAVASRVAPAPAHAGDHDHDHGGADGHAGMTVDAERFDLELEMAPTLKRIAAKSGAVELKIVAVGVDGRPMSPEQIDLQGFDILID